MIRTFRIPLKLIGALSPTRNITGTPERESAAASSVILGAAGTTMVKSITHTATHDSPSPPSP
jgi:hypothetical protein